MVHGAETTNGHEGTRIGRGTGIGTAAGARFCETKPLGCQATPLTPALSPPPRKGEGVRVRQGRDGRGGNEILRNEAIGGTGTFRGPQRFGKDHEAATRSRSEERVATCQPELKKVRKMGSEKCQTKPIGNHEWTRRNTNRAGSGDWHRSGSKILRNEAIGMSGGHPSPRPSPLLRGRERGFECGGSGGGREEGEANEFYQTKPF